MKLKTTMAAPTSTSQDMILELFAAATAEQFNERRAEVHHPFFCPVNIAIDNDKRQKFSAFSREISLSGMGLLHNMPVDCQDVMLTVYREGCPAMNIPARIMWCRPCGEGWYLSGAQFVEKC